MTSNVYAPGGPPPGRLITALQTFLTARYNYLQGAIGAWTPIEGLALNELMASNNSTIADEAGDQKAAKAFMGLALAAYRRGVLKEAETAERNAAIDALIQAEYIDVPGLELYAPLGSVDWCFTSDGTCEWQVGKDTQWECGSATPKRTIRRLTDQEAEAAGCQFE